MEISKEELVAALNVYLKQWKENPGGFVKLEDSNDYYGEDVANYILELIAEHRGVEEIK